MKQRHTMLWFVLFLVTPISMAWAGQLPLSLETYQANIRPLIEGATDDTARAFLDTCLSASDLLKGFEADDPRVPQAFDTLARTRQEARKQLSREGRRTDAVRMENKFYSDILNPYRKEDILALIRLQDQLIDRKYFQGQTTESSNFLEAYVNSHWGFTRADHSDPLQAMRDPHLGISPWEAIFRIEPALAFDSGAQPALMGTVGLTRTFFPTLNRFVNPPEFNESVWSAYLKKTGVRLGLGVARLDHKTRMLLGAGIQVSALALWGVYEPKDDEFLFAVGLSDLSVLKNIVGWYD